MPTLAEAWLAEQTAERPPWQHPPMSEAGYPRETSVSAFVTPAETWLRRWTRFAHTMIQGSEAVPAARNRPPLDPCSGSVP
jgi:hypothetical protein